MKAEMSFNKDELRLFDTDTVPMLTNEAGQYVINVSAFVLPGNHDGPALSSPGPAEAVPEIECHSVQYNRRRYKLKDYWEVRPKDTWRIIPVSK